MPAEALSDYDRWSWLIGFTIIEIGLDPTTGNVSVLWVEKGGQRVRVDVRHNDGELRHD